MGRYSQVTLIYGETFAGFTNFLVKKRMGIVISYVDETYETSSCEIFYKKKGSFRVISTTRLHTSLYFHL
jgi:hypothetical protein